MFQSGLGLFMDQNFSGIQLLRDMDTDFGILPYPKYDEAQESYSARLEAAYKCCTVPVTNNRLDLTGTMLEALYCAAYNDVIPAYYEITLKSKSVRDNDSEEMLDIISSNVRFDYGDTWWCDAIRDGVFRGMFEENSRNFASAIKRAERLAAKAIKNSITSYMDTTEE